MVGTLTALFTGLIVEMVGGVMSVELMIVKLDANAFVRLFPAGSIILFAGMVIVYFIPCCHAFGDVMVNMLPDIVLVIV